MTTSLLGALPDGDGTAFAVHAPDAERVQLCLFDDAGVESRISMSSSAGVWHGHVPGVGPGQRYGYRAHGRYAPAHGLWFDPAKLLVDPYAHALEGAFVLDDAVLSRTHDGRDSAPYVPRSIVVADSADALTARPGTPWSRTVVYELHVRGFTAAHPGVPPEQRGTYAGLAHPAALEHLLSLGVTAVELLPVQSFVSEPHLLRRGLENRWGYNTLGFFAPHAGYAADRSPGGAVHEFRRMVDDLHAAGLEVLLDVVYNHSAEGDAHGPTLSLRGLDNAGSYRLSAGRSGYDDVTGTGSTLDLRAPHVLRMVADSLRYWVTQMGVDGFRFDLAPALLRGDDAVEDRAALLAVIDQDPVLREVKLIAEPWDIGPGGYRLGQFPPPWAEWNDRFRDGVRDFWRGAGHGVRGVAAALSGSSAVFAPHGGVEAVPYTGGRAPSASVNLVTAHDGFTLHDLTAYEHKRNLANGEGNRDGSDHDRSWNCGVEGPTDDPAVLALRRRQARNMLATLLLSLGTPMLLMGDEVRRTQQGNNNAYCQDELAWQPWDLAPDAAEMLAFTRSLVALRREHPLLRSPRWWSREPDADNRRYAAWFAADGQALHDAAWDDADRQTLVLLLAGPGAASGEPGGLGDGPVSGLDESFVLVLHSGADPVDVVLPEPPVTGAWHLVVDTADERGAVDDQPAVGPGPRGVESHSLLLLQATA